MSVNIEQKLAMVEAHVAELKEIEAPLQGIEGETAEYTGRIETLQEIAAKRGDWLRLLDAIDQALPPDLWVVTLKPMRISEAEAAATQPSRRSRTAEAEATPALTKGALRGVTVRGMGYVDKVTSPEYIRTFRDRLRDSEMFSDKTEFISLPTPAPGQYVREFTLSVILEQPISL
jgi:hypothetical protein